MIRKEDSFKHKSEKSLFSKTNILVKTFVGPGEVSFLLCRIEHFFADFLKLIWGFQLWKYDRANCFHKLYVIWRLSKQIFLGATLLRGARANFKKSKNFFSIFHFSNFQNIISARLICELFCDLTISEPYTRVIVDINQLSQIGIESRESVHK